MADIVLTTLNARYWHSSFGLRYLFANLGELESRAVLLEFGINENPTEVLERILAENPRIVGFGVYIWNIEPVTRVVADLKRLRPELIVVLGGPEVSYEYEALPLVQTADYLITGEADLAFAQLCSRLLNGELPAERVIAGGVPALSEVRMPYHLYSDEDIRNRVIYVEASRGCPFTCEFCLSALEIPVRQFDLDRFLAAMQQLLERGVRQFKFVDRTFNLNLRVSRRILEFFLERFEPGLFLHFEMIPDRLPDPLRELILQFPAGALQFEVGVQTFNPEVGEFISRRQDNDQLVRNFEFLRESTGVHVHADLIVGLPGESVESFGRGFDQLVRLGPQEIQVGVLKRLRGTPITRHDDTFEMLYSEHPPYEILQTSLISFAEMQRMRRFAKYWDLVGNSGNFTETCQRLLNLGDSPFVSFQQLADWLFEQEGQTHGIPLGRLAERLFCFLTVICQEPEQAIAELIWRDYTRGGREDRPHFLRRFSLPQPQKGRTRSEPLPTRQSRHLSNMVHQPGNSEN